MPSRKIKPEVLRPFLLVLAILVALFVLQFWRPAPPDIRRQDLQKVYAADLANLYAAVKQYQAQCGELPGSWTDLLQTGFSFQSLSLPDMQPPYPQVAQTPEGPQVRNMPFALVQQGPMDFADPPRPLIRFTGTKDVPPAVIQTDGSIQWAGNG